MTTQVLPTPNTNFANLQQTEQAQDYSGVLKFIGDVAVQADKDYAEVKLTENLNSAVQAYGRSNEVVQGSNELGSVADIIADPGVRTYSGVNLNVDKNPQVAKEMEMFSQRLQALKEANVQGKLTNVAFKMRVEQITREHIARRPGYKQELATAAANELGFDPRGYTLKEMLTETAPVVSGYQKGIQESQEELGKLTGQYMQGYGLPEEAARKRAQERINLQIQQKSAEEYVGTLAKKAELTKDDVQFLENTSMAAYYSQLDSIMEQITTGRIDSREELRATLDGIEKEFPEIVKATSATLRAHNAYKSNDYTRSQIEEAIARLEKNVPETLRMLSIEVDKATDAKTGSINDELLKQRLDAINYIRKIIQPNDPGLWAWLYVNNFSTAAQASITDPRIKADLSHYFGIISNSNVINEPIPAGGATGKPAAVTAPNMTQGALAGSKIKVPTTTQGQVDLATYLATVAHGTLTAAPPRDSKAAAEQGESIATAISALADGMLAKTGNGITIGDATGKQSTINIRVLPITATDNTPSDIELSALNIAGWIADGNNSERLKAYPNGDEIADKSATTFLRALNGYAGVLNLGSTAYKNATFAGGVSMTGAPMAQKLNAIVKLSTEYDGRNPPRIIISKPDNLSGDSLKMYNNVFTVVRRLNTMAAGAYKLKPQVAEGLYNHITKIAEGWGG